jgi:uncharacterized membrane protein YgaE (UPF0421/DUF939 family)
MKALTPEQIQELESEWQAELRQQDMDDYWKEQNEGKVDIYNSEVDNEQ